MATASESFGEHRRILADALCAVSDFAGNPKQFILAALGEKGFEVLASIDWTQKKDAIARDAVRRLGSGRVGKGTPPLGRLAWAIYRRTSKSHKSGIKSLCETMGWLPPRIQKPREPRAIRFSGVIGHFKIRELLGRGAFGVVYRATDLLTQTDVALKFLTLCKDGGPETELKFPKHSRVLSPLEKPGMTDNGYTYFPLRLITGGSLRDRIEPKEGERVRMEWREAVRIVLDIARTLIELHEADILHQDLKPENILLDEKGNPYVADYGLAVELSKRHEIEARHSAAGTWPYMAPEVFEKYFARYSEDAELISVDARADIYSLGLILYEMVEGQHPTGGSGNLASRMANLRIPPSSLRVKDRRVPEALNLICRQCLRPVEAVRIDSAVLLTERLQAVLDAHPEHPALPKPIAPTALPTRQEEESYLTWAKKEIEKQALRYSPLQGLAEVRVPGKNEALLRLFEDVPDDVQMVHDPRRHGSPQSREYQDILVAFDELKRAAVLGAPGSGKSTTLRRLALELIKRAEADRRESMPVFVALRDWIGEESLEGFLSRSVPHIGYAVSALGRAGRVVLLLDGLNELPHRTRQMKDIRRVAAELPETSVFVSCRLEDYKGPLDLSSQEPGVSESRQWDSGEVGPELQPNFDRLTLVPFSRQRILAAVRLWVSTAGKPPEMADRFFWQLAGDPQLEGLLQKWLAVDPACEEAFWSIKDPSEHKEVHARTTVQDDDLWRRHIPNRRSLLKLAGNPQMLTMLFLVWTQGGDREGEEHLPRNRGDLFAKFVDRLLRREKLLVGGDLTPAGAGLLASLADLAWNMQAVQRESPAAEDESANEGTLVAVPRARALSSMGDEDLLDRACDAQLLEGGETIHFRHQLLQEYFAARAWQARLDTLDAAELWPKSNWWQPTGWEETAILLAGLYAKDCTPVIRKLAEAQPEVAARCIAESGADVPVAVVEELRVAWSRRMTGPLSDAEPEARAAVGRALGRPLNGGVMDTRKGIGLRSDGVPDIDWVDIPAGEFLYREQKERRSIGAFRIARYPVTNAQYQAFLVADDGYKEDRWWMALEKRNGTPAPSRWPELNCPRESVSWYEAMAFCKWLTHRLGYDKRDLEVRLPTEWEWERAARGAGGSEFPWGAEYVHGYANVNETYGENPGPHFLGRTSAVGIYYPHEESTAETQESGAIFDLAGNVWEWCLDESKESSRTSSGGTKARVVRGGSWFDFRGLARAGYRDYDVPVGRYLNIGFRVVCSSPMKRRSPRR